MTALNKRKKIDDITFLVMCWCIIHRSETAFIECCMSKMMRPSISFTSQRGSSKPVSTFNISKICESRSACTILQWQYNF